MAEWAEMFSKDPDLGIMEQAYMRLKTQSLFYNNQTRTRSIMLIFLDPNLHPPSKPQKTQLSDADKKREDEELQMALTLSMKDNKVPTPASAGQKQSSVPASASHPAQQQAPQPSVQPGTTAATVSRVRALFDFAPSEPGELAFRKDDIIAVLESVYKDWWKGSLRGQTGIFPLNYVEKLQDPTSEELEREAQMEAEVFAQIGNVEKLLALLSTNDTGRGDVRDNEEITELYHSTLAIRPKLIELIGKYSQKKGQANVGLVYIIRS
jgi:signal transducing adaptor molecule